jgi:two-component system, NarL family, sensor kinase
VHFRQSLSCFHRLCLSFTFDDTLKILVSDNGIGIEEDSIKKGMGMSNLKSRVTSLNGKMAIGNREGGYAVIEVPV